VPLVTNAHGEVTFHRGDVGCVGYITMQTSMGNSKYLTRKVVRSISLEFGVCEMNNKKMHALVNRLREYAIGIRMRVMKPMR